MSRTGPVGVGILGCGNVGGALVSLLYQDAEAIARSVGIPLHLVGVAVNDPGKARPAALRQALLRTDAMGLVDDPEVEVVVELMGGIEPARSCVLAALRSGKPVVTGNKELLATHGGELAQAAVAAGVDLLYEAAVGGAIPLVRVLRESLAGERIDRVLGIVNGTTNYVLTKMSDEGMSFDEAVADAQALGFAERDPSSDIDGFDAAAKASIMASIAFAADVAVADVHREGIRHMEAGDIAFAQRSGYAVKLLAIVERVAAAGEPDRIGVRVHPALIDRSHPLATVKGPFNAMFIEGGAAGELMLYGRGAGGMPTASAVLGDLIDAAHNLRAGSGGRTPTRSAVSLFPMGELRARHYLALEVVDRPGVLATVAGVFGEHGVSISSMEQVGTGDGARLVFLTHEAVESAMAATVEDLGGLDPVLRVGSRIRIVE